MSWPLAEIESLVEKVSKWNPRHNPEAEVFKYVDLSSVDKETKTIDGSLVTLVEPVEAPSRARQLIDLNDVLVSTVRPNLNGVALVDDETFSGATASTGYCVLRPKKNKLDSRYLYYWVKTDAFIDDMVKRSTGANYPAISDKTVKSHKIPLPPLEEQKRIAAILDKADALRRKRQQAIDLTDQLLRSVFLDMFGDPVTNPKGIKKAVIGDLVDVKGGYAFKSKDYTESGVRLVKISNVHAEELIWKDTSCVPNEYLNKYAEFSLKQGDIVIALTRPIIASQNHVKVASVSKSDLPVLLNQRVGKMEIKSELLVREYLEQFLYGDEFRNTVDKLCSVALQPNISTKQIEGIEILLPSLEQQMKFKEISEKIKKSKYVQYTNLNKSGALFDSLTQQAFQGELTKQTKAA